MRSTPSAARLCRLATRGGWRVDGCPGGAESLVLSFASIGHDPARAPSPEFVATATAGGRPALFISDESRSWGRAPGLAEVLSDALAALCLNGPPARIAAIGQSMGAVLALRATALLPVDCVLAFGPQSHLGPPETRWSPWGPAAAPLAPADWPAQTRVTLFHGLADDAAQAAGFAPRPGMDHILFPGITHSDLCPHLKRHGVLAGLLDAALAADRRRLLRIASSAGGRLRQRLPEGQLPR